MDYIFGEAGPARIKTNIYILSGIILICVLLHFIRFLSSDIYALKSPLSIRRGEAPETAGKAQYPDLDIQDLRRGWRDAFSCLISFAAGLGFFAAGFFYLPATLRYLDNPLSPGYPTFLMDLLMLFLFLTTLLIIDGGVRMTRWRNFLDGKKFFSILRVMRILASNDLKPLLKTARQDAGMTQKQVGYIWGRSPSFISSFETGRKKLTLGDLYYFALIYKKDIAYFAGNQTGFQ